MKEALFLLLVLTTGTFLVTTKFTNTPVKSEEKIATEMEVPTAQDLGRVLGETAGLVEKEIISKPEEIAQNLITNVLSQATSDTANLTSQITSSIIADQLVNSYKGLTSEAKNKVQEAICR